MAGNRPKGNLDGAAAQMARATTGATQWTP